MVSTFAYRLVSTKSVILTPHSWRQDIQLSIQWFKVISKSLDPRVNSPRSLSDSASPFGVCSPHQGQDQGPSPAQARKLRGTLDSYFFFPPHFQLSSPTDSSLIFLGSVYPLSILQTQRSSIVGPLITAPSHYLAMEFGPSYLFNLFI